VGALLVALIPKAQVAAIRYAALIASVATFGLSVVLLHGFSSSTFHFQWVEFVPWIARAGIHYRVGVDGFSIWLVLLTTFLSFISVWFSFYIKDRVKEYMLFMLALETAMLGVFVSLDMIVFYTFFEFSLIPMYFLIAIWGGNRRAYASLKFFLFTFAGSIFMLLGMIVLFVLNWRLTGTPSFSILDIQSAVASGKLWAGSPHLEPWVFWAFAVAFLVKCPAFPFHTWLPDAHVEAPTAGSVILAGVLLKMGTYGFLRFCLPLFPDTLPSQVPILMLLAVIGIIYGAVVAAVQPDLKKLVAYSSVAHMGFVMLGIFSLNHAGILGGSFQQLSHGVSTGALFLLVGLIYERRHTREFKDFGGLKAQMPIFAAIFLIIMLSSAGLPGTNGFVGEFLALLGAAETCFNRLYGLDPAFVVIAGGGVILAAVYLLYMFQQVFYGPNTNPDNKRLKDLKPWEVVMAGSLVVLVFWGGLFPNTFIGPMEASATATRLMATLPAGQRPVWSDPSQEVSAAGNQSQLVSLGDGRLGAGAIIATT
ncbi:MAG: NADH-quinone oxidoreductase subunit M, partial [Fimbriimonas ginsengisoli]|nr:NADH-quinone oxidoreductase subunit M [Fimbriimonas ginsengisoli]